VRGKDISPTRFGAAVARAARAAKTVERTLDDGEKVTQFELVTAAAFSELAHAGVDAAAIEAGLGGRWDATNVLDAPVVVLTNVGLEHTRWLGSTITDIAREKLAVVPAGGTVVCGPLHPEAREVVQHLDARVVDVTAPLDVALPHYQRLNAAVARAAVEQLLGEVDEQAVRQAATSVAVPGRFQIVGESPLTIVDGAHNPDGVAALAAALPEAVGDRPLIACVSILDDKDATGMLRSLLPLCRGVIFTTSSNPRALPPATLVSLAGQVDPTVDTVIDREPRRAFDRARRIAGSDGAVVATGSIYLVADLLSAPGTRRASAL
jgi:dihydrofolate synthase/folylpolyglutamate synthase